MTLNEVAARLTAADNLLVCMHVSPDGDCAGSAVALCLALRALGKTAFVAPVNDLSRELQPYVMPLLAKTDFAPEFVVSVDTAAGERLADGAPSQVQLAIDHHVSHKPYAEHTCVLERASCGEIIYELLAPLGVALTPALAEPLYIAVSTDTGCFKFGNTTPHTHQVAAALMETCFDAARVNHLFFEQKSPVRIALEQAVLSGMELLADGKVAVMTLTQAMMDAAGAAEADTDALSALTRIVEGVHIGIFLKEKQGVVKVSVRTLPDCDASAICALFGGGGHRQAAGCTIETDLTAARLLLLDAVGTLYPSCKV